MVKGLGERLQELRINLKLSQKEVAASLDVSPSIVSNYENNERVPSVEILASLARLYHCSTDYLLGLQLTDHDHVIDVSMLNLEQRLLLQSFLDSIQK